MNITAQTRKSLWESLSEPKPDWEAFKRISNRCQDIQSVRKSVAKWRKENKFIPDSVVSEVAATLTELFHFEFTSFTPQGQVASRAKEEFQDLGFSPRWSVCLLAAKQAKAAWFGQVQQTKQQIALSA